MMFEILLILFTLVLNVISLFVTLVITRSWYQLSHPPKDKDEWYIRADRFDRRLKD